MDFRDEQLGKIADISFVSHPYDNVRTELSFLENYRLFSPHNRDLLYLFGMYVVIGAGIAAAAIFAFAGNRLQQYQVVFGATVLGGLLTIAAKLVDSSQKRLAIVDLFASEILSLGRIFVACNIIGSFICLFDQLSTPIPAEADASPTAASQQGPFGFADAARKENYFTVFEKNNTDLGPLAADTIADITAFYTFLKASRDSTGAMSLWNAPHYNAALRQNDVVSIIYNCFLMAGHGRHALQALIEERQRAAYATEVFDSIAVKCYLFLMYVLPATDSRHKLLSARARHFLGVIASHGERRHASTMEVARQTLNLPPTNAKTGPA